MAFQSCDAGQAEILSPKPTLDTHLTRRDSMTDTFYPATTITGHDSVHASLPNTVAFSHNQRYGVSVLDGALEDDGQISCFCGFPDDDGNTVACDECNRWNHTICYYPQWDGRDLPDDLQHFCVECRPRAVDAHAANARQRVRREQQEQLINGTRRPPAKSHKKKVKEPAASGYTNGWPLDKVRHDRNSASPRDQPPPSKRPKTSHRPSDVTTVGSAKGHSRKRTATNASHRRSLSQSPEAPIEVYSPEFLRCFTDDQWSVTDANLYNGIGVTNTLYEWLHVSDEIFRARTGLEKVHVLQRWDGELNDIPGKPQIEIQPQCDPNFLDEDGNNPTWRTVIVQGPVAQGGYIGELKGHVGFQEEYKTDACNRWSLLRHPEPFVFFHPRLPIYVDARNEGTELRYVRRSCHPNAELKILVTNQTDYRFCFMATEQIEPGTEMAVAWDTAEMPSTREMEQICSWVSTALSNCGLCACYRPSSECKMSRFDRRGTSAGYEEEAQPVKMPKAKKRKAGHHISPLNTHVLNSRSGSEARKGDLDDEPTDSRSASGSGDRGSASRDMTPNTHYSANGSLSAMPELSARERKKLEKEEEMFKRQEEEQSGKQTKKKRNSVGSNVNTPSATSSKQLTFPSNSSRYADAGTSRQSGLPSAKSLNGKGPQTSTMQKTSGKSIVKVVKKPKPTYIDAETQCDMDEEEARQRAATPSPRRKYISVTQRLLERCAINNARSKARHTVSEATESPPDADTMDVDPPAIQNSDSPRSASTSDIEYEPEYEPELALAPVIADDARMVDITSTDEATSQLRISVPEVQEPVDAHGSGSSKDSVLSHSQPMEPPAPPWPSENSPTADYTSAGSPISHRSAEMHIQMPPPTLSTTLSAGSPNSITGSIAQSPASLMASGPIFSPAVNAAVVPSPARKKLSLSDYTRRSKAKDNQHEPRYDRDSSPASVASGPSVPPLQSTMSEVARAGSAAVEEDVPMEDSASHLA